MNILPEEADYIRKNFEMIRDKDEFLSLLNYAKAILYGKDYKPFRIRQLNYYINTASKGNSYQTFQIKKKAGGTRTIFAPNEGLKAIQSCLSLILGTLYQANASATGFVRGRSIFDNAKIHVGQHYVFNIDLKDFFPSIDQARVWGRLKLAPFNLGEKNGRQILANIIAKLCCHEFDVERMDVSGEWKKEKRSVLPQGAPTSPVISNLICEKLDKRLVGIAKRFGLKYSRYADDITFSSLHYVYHRQGDFFKEVERVINDQNFHIKESKTRIQGEGYRQEVTGLVVNDKVNVRKRYVKELRKWLYLWETYGYEKTYVFFRISYLKDGRSNASSKPDMSKVMAGKLDFLKMIRGAQDPLYRKLLDRFQKLSPKHSALTIILDTWEKFGIEKAMEKFYEYRTA